MRSSVMPLTLVVAALEVITPTTPKLRESTAPSAMRLTVDFKDNCFLSIIRSEEFGPIGFG